MTKNVDDMAFEFKALKKNPHLFFGMLPQDWQDEILPYWENHKHHATIYALWDQDTLLGGGIVFYDDAPNIPLNAKETRQWFENGYHYLGFIWIAEHYRGHHLGSFWLRKLKETFPTQKYWLLIEAEGLHGFYERNGFVRHKAIALDSHTEWLYVFTPEHL